MGRSQGKIAMRWTVYSTDAMVYCLCVGVLLWAYGFRHSTEWQRIRSMLRARPRYWIALWVVGLYGLVGFLDSVHFENKDSMHAYANKSILDFLISPLDQKSELSYAAPSKAHPLGTDKVGRDVLYLSVKSIRTGLIIGSLTTLVMLPFALLFGMWAGYFRGRVDDIIQYTYTTLSSIPGILLIAAAMLSFQVKIESDSELRLLILCVILGVSSWTTLCRLLRGETLKLRSSDFVQSAMVLGVRNLGIMRRHIMPNLMHIVIITVVLDFSALVLAEAVLSYVGVGVSPVSYSWGNLINASRLDMARDPVVWWTLAGALFFMFALVFSANLLSDAVQEALDPKAN